jgi:hypothetical protein
LLSVANSAGNVQITAGTTSILATGLVNASAFTTTGNANAANFYSGANALFSATSLLWTGNTTTSPTITLANTGAFTVGNSTTTQTTSTKSVANSTGNVQITPGTASINATGSVNAASHTVGTAFTANALGVYTTGTVNALSHSTGTSFVANTTALYVNSAIYLAGSNGTAGQVLTSNGTSNAYWSTVSGGGSVTAFSANVGDATNTSYTITHNLNKTNIFATIREQASGYLVYPDIQYNNSNSIILTFSSAPTANQYFASIIGG